MENWQSVNNYEGIYEISSYGRLRSLKFNRLRYFNLKADGWGYVIVVLHKKGKREAVRFHRLVASHFIANPDNKKEVNHKDGNKLNNRVDNLEWVTPEENMKHAFSTKLNVPKKGEKHQGSKLSNRKAQMIKDLYATGIYKQSDIGEEFNISQTRVSAIVLGQTTY